MPKPAGRRPVLLLSRPTAYRYLHKFIAVEITTTVRGIQLEVSLGNREGLPKHCVANFDNLRTVSKFALVKRLGGLSPSRHQEVKRALGYAVGWEELISS